MTAANLIEFFCVIDGFGKYFLLTEKSICWMYLIEFIGQ